MMNMKNLLSGAAIAAMIAGSGFSVTAASAQSQDQAPTPSNAQADQPAEGAAATPTQRPSQGEGQTAPAAGGDETAGAATPDENRLIAKVNDVEIRQADVLNAIEGLPPQVRQMPPQMLLPVVVEQLLLRELILEKGYAENLQSDPAVVATIESQNQALQEQAIVNLWLERELAERITDERINEAYQQYRTANPDTTITLDIARPQLEQALRQQAMRELATELREGATVVFYDASGNPLPEDTAGGANATGEEIATNSSGQASSSQEGSSDANTASAENTMVPFEQADADNSGSLDAEELRPALYRALDTDGSATLEEQEYAVGGRIFKEVDLSKYDADGDRSLSSEEFGEGYLEEATFEDFDGDDDGAISSQEYLDMYSGN